MTQLFQNLCQLKFFLAQHPFCSLGHSLSWFPSLTVLWVPTCEQRILQQRRLHKLDEKMLEICSSHIERGIYSIETCVISRVKQITSTGWMHEARARAWCTGKTQRDRVEREVGGGIGMGNTCKSMADSCQCMTKITPIL